MNLFKNNIELNHILMKILTDTATYKEKHTYSSQPILSFTITILFVKTTRNLFLKFFEFTIVTIYLFYLHELVTIV